MALSPHKSEEVGLTLRNRHYTLRRDLEDLGGIATVLCQHAVYKRTAPSHERQGNSGQISFVRVALCLESTESCYVSGVDQLNRQKIGFPRHSSMPQVQWLARVRSGITNLPSVASPFHFELISGR